MRRLLTRHWIGVHLAVWSAVAVCIALGWWQAARAGDGNMRSYGYAAEWPTFALIFLFLWVRAMRAELQTPEPDHPAERESATPADDAVVTGRLNAREVIARDEAEDAELAAYNRYLAGLNDRHLSGRR